MLSPLSSAACWTTDIHAAPFPPQVCALQHAAPNSRADTMSAPRSVWGLCSSPSFVLPFLPPSHCSPSLSRSTLFRSVRATPARSLSIWPGISSQAAVHDGGGRHCLSPVQALLNPPPPPPPSARPSSYTTRPSD